MRKRKLISRIILAIIALATLALCVAAIYGRINGVNVAMNDLVKNRYEEIVEEAAETGSNPILSNVKEIE